MDNKKIDTGTIVRTIVLAVMLINEVLIRFGITPFELDESLIYEFVSAVGLIGASVWSWWKNNSFTNEAKTADIVMHALKDGKDVDYKINDIPKGEEVR